MGEGYAVGRKGGIPRKVLNARVGLYYTASEVLPANVYVELDANGKLIRSEKKIFGLTKTKCSPDKAGRVWML